MKKIQVKVCVCTACVMNGSVEIMESVESLRDLREQMEEGYTAEEHEVLEIATDKCLGGLPHQEDAPVIVGGRYGVQKSGCRIGHGLYRRACAERGTVKMTRLSAHRF